MEFLADERDRTVARTLALEFARVLMAGRRRSGVGVFYACHVAHTN